MENLPIIWLEIDFDDQDTGVDVISFVTKPATELAWNKYSENKHFKFLKNETKRVVTGPVMLADTPIYRFSDLIGPYYCKFSDKTIFNMMKKYFKQNKIHRVNEQHNSKRVVKGVMLIESFIVGERVTSNLYPDLPEGTWMASFFVEDEDYWNNVIMKDEFTGFSLEGVFDQVYDDELVNELYNTVKDIIFSDISDEEKEKKIANI
jgi:hypothetical protein